MSLFRKAPTTTSTIIIKNGGVTTVSQVTEDDIRKEAYRIWENEGKQGDSLEHWLKAKQNIEKRIIENFTNLQEVS